MDREDHQITVLEAQELLLFHPPFTWDSGVPTPPSLYLGSVETIWPISSTNYPGEKKTRAGVGLEGQSR